jgi:serine/threonine protein kinase
MEHVWGRVDCGFPLQSFNGTQYDSAMTEWAWDETRSIGGGGFGQVYEAHGPGSGPLAAKVVPKAPGATREQIIAQDVPVSKHVVPIVHAEETDEAFVLFMPRAEFSLRQKIGEGITAADAIDVLIEVAEGLSDIAATVVHRDIKPDNVLFVHDTWALCDFGIARYADATTGEHTRKYSLSASYAAPEQWRYEHATSATDIYAFGVMAYELLSGTRPFIGTPDELRQQHLTAVPATLPGNKKLAWIVNECLSKAPEARPTAANLLLRLRRAGEDAASTGASSLAAAQSAILEARAAEQAQLEQDRSERERREALGASARLGYSALAEELIEYVTENAPATLVDHSKEKTTLALGSARLTLSKMALSGPLPGSFDVIAFGQIGIEAGGKSRSHSLYFADFASAHSYTWFELGFMAGVFGGGADFQREPRAVAPAEGLGAFEGITGSIQLGWGMKSLDIGDLREFIQFWSDYFGKAAGGHFPAIYSLPDGLITPPVRRYS